jgi:hypothetical protein
MRVPILPAERSQMPKKGVVTGSSLCQRPPSAGRRRWTSLEVRLVFHLYSQLHSIHPASGRHTL